MYFIFGFFYDVQPHLFHFEGRIWALNTAVYSKVYARVQCASYVRTYKINFSSRGLDISRSASGFVKKGNDADIHVQNVYICPELF